MSEKGINLIFLEIDYSFEFQSHPELRYGSNPITKSGAQRFAKVCKKHKVKLIPQFQCFGHQSWAEETYPLLTVYPELDLTPGAYPNNENIYCREWDPTNPKVNEIIFPLIDEITEAFSAEGIHVGMDEIFLINADEAIYTKNMDPALVFSDVVNQFHDHFVKEKGLEMYLWADRLIDGEKYGYGEWEASMNGTAPAIDLIPTDVILCDWHYEPMSSYPSIPMFLEKGFRVLPCSFRKINAMEALIKYSYQFDDPNMLGHMFTTWGRRDSILGYNPMNKGIELIKSKMFYDVDITNIPSENSHELSVELAVNFDDSKIYYTTDGSTPTQKSFLYESPVNLSESCTLKALSYKNNKPIGAVSQKSFAIHKALSKNLTLQSESSNKFKAIAGLNTLVDGMLGSDSYADGHWLAFDGQDMDVTIDLAQETSVSSIEIHSSNNRSNWVYPAGSLEVFGSNDGISFDHLATQKYETTEGKIAELTAQFETTNYKYVKIVAKHQKIPEGRDGAGSDAWLFVDEVIIN
jgi:hypothetical protein